MSQEDAGKRPFPPQNSKDIEQQLVNLKALA